jgi:hypothetical protein
MKKQLLLLLLVLFICFSVGQAQMEIPVDMYTGSPSIAVPLWTITDHDISESIGLVYNPNSVKAGEPSGFYGLGWNLQAAFSISREVRGLPDDWGNNDVRKGWFSVNSSGETCGLDIARFPNTADQSAATLDDEATDYEAITGYNYRTDPEPDIFYYSIGGYSGSFVFDGNMTVRMIPYRDIRIEYTLSTDKKLSSFKITTNTGYSYTFSQVGSTTKTVEKNSALNDVYALNTEYELYKTSVTYNSEWKVSRIDSPSGAYLTFSYIADTFDDNHDLNIGFYKTVSAIELGSTDLQLMKLYTVKQSVTRQYVSSISASSGTVVELSYTSASKTLNALSIKDSRRGSDNLVKQFSFSYRLVAYTEGNTTVYSRQFLEKITELSGCDVLAPYTFSYAGLNSQGELPYPGNAIDLWGYYNGRGNTTFCPKLYIYPSEALAERYRYVAIPGYTGTEIILNGADRSPSRLMTMGTLYSIIYPGGGVTRFEFEPNSYYDARIGQSLPGGGMRIVSATYWDGINPITITKKIQYQDAAGNSSGRLLTKPVFFMPAYKWKNPNKLNSTDAADSKLYTSLSGNDAWKFLTLRTDIDLAGSDETYGSPVGYTTVTVTRPGAGSAKFEYYEPGVYGETSNGDWSATQNRFARPSVTPALEMGVASAWGAWALPYTRNPNYDYERGLLWKKTEYSSNGNIARLTENTYQYLYRFGTVPLKVWGLRYDKFPFSGDNSSKAFFYGKYYLLTDVDKVLKQEKVTTYDAASIAKYTAETTEYSYTSLNHKLLTQVRKTTPDGTQYTSYIRYPKDYAEATSNAEEAVLMLTNLQNNSKHGLPVELYSTIKKPGDNERVLSGSITKYSAFSLGRPLPISNWALRIQKPVRIDSFRVSSVVLQGSYKFDIDPAYEQTVSYNDYLNYNNSSSVTGTNRIARAITWGYNYTLPVAQAINATHLQFGFTDFETTTGQELQVTNARFGTGRTGVNALYPAVTVFRNIDKATVSNYILSFWVKNTANQNFTIALKSIDATATYYTNTLSAPASGGTDFRYIEFIIPVTSVPAGTFRVEFSGQGLTNPASSSPGLVPVIDDVIFYPENASVTSYTYEIPYGTKSTTQGGITTYTAYDKLGRQKYTLDKDKNIIQKKTYTFATDKVPLVADFLLPVVLYATEPVTFTATDNPCVSGVTYEWDFGSGYTAGSRIQSFTFSTAGMKTINLRVTGGGLVKTISKTITASLRPISMSICAKGVQEFSASNNLIISSYSCSSITDTPSVYGVIFRVSGMNADGELVYKWKLRNAGSYTWTQVGTDIQYNYVKVVSTTKTFEVQCDVTDTDTGRTGSSDIMTVTVSQ